MFEYESDKPKVLLVDDKIRNLVLICDILSPLDLEIYVARNGHEAIRRAEETDFDMILLDILMPDLDGYEVCRRIKSSARQKDLSILFMSALRTLEDKTRGFESGADDYLVKPFYEKEVLARVRLHLRKRSVIKHLRSLLKRSYHELYNPLSVIRTSAEMYGYHYPKNRYVDTMHAAAGSLQVIYEDLYYALGTTTTQPRRSLLDFAAFLRERIAFFDLQAEVKNILLHLDAQEGCFVEAFSSDLRRIVDNTISNAIKYADDGSQITVVLSKKPQMTLSVTNRGNTIIDPVHIFSEGYREGYETTGMGIGLEIVASICRRLNIAARVDSSDRVTTFTYIFHGKGKR